MSIVQLPLRLTTGAFILNSGIGKRKMPDEQAEAMRDMAANGVPYFKEMDPAQFRRFLTVTEVGVGAALLLPVVPGWLAGSALTAFSGGLVSMYLNTPSMTEADGIRPSQEGTSVAKDFMMLGSGVALVLDSVLNRGSKKRKAALKRAAKIASAKDERVEAINKARDEQVESLRQARKELRAQRKSAKKN